MQRQLRMGVFAMLLLAANVPKVVGEQNASNTTESPNPGKPNFNVMKTVIEATQHELKHSSVPLAVGGVALVFGAIMLFSGERFFELLVTFAISVVCGIVTKEAVLSYWLEHHIAHSFPRHIVADIAGLEVALIAAAATHKGFKGTLVLIGAGLGFCMAAFVSGFMVDHFKVILNAEVSLIWYTLCALPFSVMLYKDKHLCLLAIVSPLVGGAFVSSAVLYFGTELLHMVLCSHDGVCKGGLHPKTGQWVEFFLLSFNISPSADEDVGPFARSSDNNVDQIVSVVLWILLSCIGMKIQVTKHRQRAASQLAQSKSLKIPKEARDQFSELQGRFDDLEKRLLPSDAAGVAPAKQTGGAVKAQGPLKEALIQKQV